jgi:hypothetical protein
MLGGPRANNSVSSEIVALRWPGLIYSSRYRNSSPVTVSTRDGDGRTDGYAGRGAWDDIALCWILHGEFYHFKVASNTVNQR